MFCLIFFVAAHCRRLCAYNGIVGERRAFQHVQHLLQAHSSTLDFHCVHRTARPFILRGDGTHPLCSWCYVADTQCRGNIPLYVYKNQAQPQSREVHGSREQAFVASQNIVGPRRSRQNILSQGQSLLHLLRHGRLHCKINQILWILFYFYYRSNLIN